MDSDKLRDLRGALVDALESAAEASGTLDDAFYDELEAMRRHASTIINRVEDKQMNLTI